MGGGLIGRVGSGGTAFEQRLRAIAAKHPVIKEVRGADSCGGLQLASDAGPIVPASVGARGHREPNRGDSHPPSAAAGHHRKLKLTRRSRSSTPHSATSAPTPRGEHRHDGTQPSDPSNRRPVACAAAACVDLREPRRRAPAPPHVAGLTVHAERFVVALRGRKVVGCAELAPLSPRVAEVRIACGGSFGTQPRRRHHAGLRSSGPGGAARGFRQACAFTHAPAYFIQMGFSIVPHLWLAVEDLHRLLQVRRVPPLRTYAMGASTRNGP